MPHGAHLTSALRAALAEAHSPWRDGVLEPLRDKGLAHDHVRLVGTGALARIPKQSQLGLAAADNLAYQSACFARAAAGGHAPQLLGMLPPSAHLPRGALIVEDIVGRAATLPGDLAAVVRALAALHALPLPPPEARAPLLNASDPLQALHDEITAQAQHLPAANVAPAVASAIAAERAALRAACALAGRPPQCLIAFDGHPGNFIVRPDGAAVLVDLEKCRYSYPGLDLAHATLYTSTTWDVESRAVLDTQAVLQAYATWEGQVPPAVASAARPWHLPLRRAMWLWSVTWCAKWRALSANDAASRADGEDWSAARSDAALVKHVRDRVDEYLAPEVVAYVRDGFAELGRALAA